MIGLDFKDGKNKDNLGRDQWASTLAEHLEHFIVLLKTTFI